MNLPRCYPMVPLLREFCKLMAALGKDSIGYGSLYNPSLGARKNCLSNLLSCGTGSSSHNISDGASYAYMDATGTFLSPDFQFSDIPWLMLPKYRHIDNTRLPYTPPDCVPEPRFYTPTHLAPRNLRYLKLRFPRRCLIAMGLTAR